MRDFGKVLSRFWTGQTGKEIRRSGAACQLISLYLLSCPNSNAIGLYYLPLVIAAHEVGFTVEEVRKVLLRLREIGFAAFDEISETVYVFNMARFQLGASLKRDDKNVPWVRREVAKMRYSPFFDEFVALHRDDYHLSDLTSADQNPAKSSPRPRDMTEAQAQAEIEERRKMAKAHEQR
jgi:hypothetical protein